MPTLETPPNPAAPPPKPEKPVRITTGRFGQLDHSEIVHLLSSLDDEVARSRFRESIYISLIICLALAWLALYGPRVLFHQGRLVEVQQHRNKNELTYLEMPKDLQKAVPPPKAPKVIADQSHRAQTPTPTPRQPTPEELQAMRRAGRPSQPAPRPNLPNAPQPQPQQPPQQQQPQQQQQPPPPRPQPQVASNMPEAPRPAPSASRPNFSTPTTPGQSISEATRNARNQSGQGGDNGLNAPRSHNAAKAQVEILSDTLGVDFEPYIRRLVRTTENAWEPLIPEECREPLFKTGQTYIRFTIQSNGVVSAMHLDDSTHDIAIDRSAWGSITSQGQLPPLPSTFKGPELVLRFHFIMGREGSSAQ